MNKATVVTHSRPKAVTYWTLELPLWLSCQPTMPCVAVGASSPAKMNAPVSQPTLQCSMSQPLGVTCKSAGQLISDPSFTELQVAKSPNTANSIATTAVFIFRSNAAVNPRTGRRPVLRVEPLVGHLVTGATSLGNSPSAQHYQSRATDPQAPTRFATLGP
jgi:hypothetical protein